MFVPTTKSKWKRQKAAWRYPIWSKVNESVGHLHLPQSLHFVSRILCPSYKVCLCAKWTHTLTHIQTHTWIEFKYILFAFAFAFAAEAACASQAVPGFTASLTMSSNILYPAFPTFPFWGAKEKKEDQHVNERSGHSYYSNYDCKWKHTHIHTCIYTH